jgi:signal transduction histidine kinase
MNTREELAFDRSPSDQRLADLAMLGHELRNPLAAAQTCVAAAAAITPAGDSRQPLLHRASRDLERLGGLLTSYLELLGGRLQRTTLVDVGACVRGVAARRGPAVTARASGAELMVTGNAALLERAVENLVDNAFACGAKRVDLLAARQADQLVLEVSDDGPGVAPALRERLFAPFASGRGSTGLGLVLVKDIAVAHGGSVRLAASAPGGARFVLSLPGAGAPARTAAAGVSV